MNARPDANKIARVSRVLSSPVRLRIIQLLKGRPLCVNALAARLGVTQGAVSQHLRIMRDAGLVQARKQGYYVHYSLNGAALCRRGGSSFALSVDAVGAGQEKKNGKQSS